jgi:uncharacterized protein (TIGR03435 family)
MPEPDDITLLQDYAENNSQPAFAALVKRHVNLVYSTALRSAGSAHAAEEITQAVFIILARKADSLRRRAVLSGWLYQTTRLTAANYLRTEIRRQKREQEAYMQSHLNETDSDAWIQIAPLLESAMAGLSEQDRNVIVLRFFENKNSREIAESLGVHEPAAKKRVTRAMERLRAFFARRGVVLTATAIAGAVSAHSVQAAPANLAAAITTAAASKGVATGGSTLTLIKTTLKLMAWTKAKTAIIVGVGVLLAAGTATVTVKEVQEHKAYPWQMARVNSTILDQAEPQVRIVPTRFTQFGGWTYNNRSADRKVIGICAPVKEILQAAYGELTARTVFPAVLPQEKYDFIANLPTGSMAALQQEIKKQFGLSGSRQMHNTDVLLLTVKSHAPGLKPAEGRGSVDNRFIGPGECSVQNQPLTGLAELLESYFEMPVIDRSGVTTNFDIDVHWDEQDYRKNPDGLKRALLDQLGLELVPAREGIDMLIIEKSGD